METSMRADFERLYREEHADSDYDAVEIYGTYAKTTPESDVYPAHTLYNPADVVHPVRPLNEISREELLDIVSNGPSSKRSSKQASPGHSHIATPNASFKLDGAPAAVQVRAPLDSKARLLEEENQRLHTKVKILEENAIREREEWMTKYFDHIRDCKSRKSGDSDKLKCDLQRELDHSDRLQRELSKSRSEAVSLLRDLETREADWEETTKELKRQLAIERQKNQEDMVAIRHEFARIQSELDRVKSKKISENKPKSGEYDSESARKLMDREVRGYQKQVTELRERLLSSQEEVERLKDELRLATRDRSESGETSRRSLSTRKSNFDRDVTPARQSTRLLATKKGRSFSGANNQSRSNKELKHSAKPSIKAEDLNESIARMEARITRHRERYLGYVHSQSHTKEELTHLNDSIGREESQLSKLRGLQDELRRRR